MISLSSIISDLIFHKNIRIIIGQDENFRTPKTNLINDFYYHPSDPNDWIHTLQAGRLLPDNWGHVCLNDPKTLDRVIESVEKIKTDKIISISQPDSNDWCDCSTCSKERPSETLIRFVNQVAERFPQKRFSTLAYFKTEEPPTVNPIDNVQVIITTIEIPKDKPYRTSSRNDVVAWRRRLKKWLSLTKNIVVWDYYSNFRHLLMPYPVLLNIGKNIRWMYFSGVRNFIVQTNAGTGHEFSELKSHLVSEMLWNPMRDPEKAINSFLSTYYSQAAPYIRQYIDLLHKEQAGGKPLINWSDPAEFDKSFLSPKNLEKYSRILTEALNCTSSGDTKMRVRTVFLQIWYTLIEMGLERSEDIDSFKLVCRSVGGVTVNEYNLTAEQYLKNKSTDITPTTACKHNRRKNND